MAAAEEHVLTTHILVQAGATLDVLDDEQNTALMIASQEGKSDIVRYLLYGKRTRRKVNIPKL